MSSVFFQIILGGKPQAPGHHFLDKTPKPVHSKIGIFNYLPTFHNRAEPISTGGRAPSWAHVLTAHPHTGQPRVRYGAH